MSQIVNDYTLGIDLGTNSVGWAIIHTTGNKPSGIVKVGSHIFEAGMEGDIETGQQESRNLKRRNARQARRQLDRRKRRKQRLRRIMQDAGIMPNDEEFAEYIRIVDEEAAVNYYESGNHKAFFHIIPYVLRTRALDHKLSLNEFGRALYHLAQRRGFLSNRKTRNDEETGIVKPKIAALAQDIEATGCRTLGEYFSKIDPQVRRIRAHYTHRDMFEHEFELIWNRQKEFYPDVLTDTLKEKVHNAIFYQRPLRSVKHLIGNCEFEENEKRCPWYNTEAQRFRLLQSVNNLRVRNSEEPMRALTQEERQILLMELEKNERITFAAIKKLLSLKPRATKFNLEEGGEKSIKGNTTTARMYAVFGEKWFAMDESDRELAIHDILCFEKTSALKRRGATKWHLEGDALEAFCHVTLEDDYCNLSKKAIMKLMPDLEEGMTYAEAATKVYNMVKRTEPVELLPAVCDVFDSLRNPIVNRTLSELRSIVNAITAEYGKPAVIRIEMARDIKRSKKQKKIISERNKAQQKRREKAAELILKECSHIQKPSRTDILRVMLADECNWICPYTGKSFGWDDLLGRNPSIDIEHIIPYSVSLDDSFLNKTLCYNHENRNVKKNRSPWQAYGGDDENFDLIVSRVKKFNGDGSHEKLKRFLMEDLSIFDDFSNRHLNDTSYAARLAAEYLGLLYGGVIDEDGKRRIQTVSGPITAHMRRAAGLNHILARGKKTRDDHRHHAIDALTVALTNANSIKELSRMAATQQHLERIILDSELIPWTGFLDEARIKIDRINVTHHKSHKVRGPLHKETNYAVQEEGNVVHVRKQLSALSQKDIANIVDDAVRQCVQRKLQELNMTDPGKAFASEENYPRMKTKNGTAGPLIKSARIKANLKTISIGKKPHNRNIVTGNNHHIEVVASLDADGKVLKWDGCPVSMLDAYQRKQKGQDIVNKHCEEDQKFICSLACGDILEMDSFDGDGRELYIIRTVPESLQLSFVKLSEARKQTDVKKSKQWQTKRIGPLKDMNPRKVWLTPLGEVRRAND